MLQSRPPSPVINRTNLLGKQQTTINFLYCFHLCPVSWSILRFFLSRLKAATTCKKEKSSQSNSFQFHLLDPNLSSTRRTTSEFFPLDIFHLGAIINHGQKTTTNKHSFLTKQLFNASNGHWWVCFPIERQQSNQS